MSLFIILFLSLIIIIVFYYTKYLYYTQRIPKIIIQTWNNDIIPPKYVKDVNSVKTHNPAYEYLFFNDDTIEIFLETNYPEYYDTYKKFPKKIQKIDFFRYIAIYHYGGFYLDLDIRVNKPLDNLLHHYAVFPIDLHILPHMCKEDRFKKFYDKGQRIMVGQYAFGAVPRHPFIKKLIDSIHENIDYYVETYKTNKSLQYVYETTGPDFVTNKYLEYKPNDVYILYHKEGQQFGNYATHNHYGTWK